MAGRIELTKVVQEFVDLEPRRVVTPALAGAHLARGLAYPTPPEGPLSEE